MRKRVSGATLVILICMVQCTVCYAKAKKPARNFREEYIARMKGSFVQAAPATTLGSLWADGCSLNEMASDYKAHALNDTVTVLVSVQTAAAQSGTVSNQRDFTTSSAVTSVLGKAPTATNPLLSAQSSSALKGAGATSSNTTFQTSLTGQVIALLANGNMIIEAQRKIFMNNQHEEILIRGLVRPGDIGPGNVVSSTALSNLEIEMKGKGIISDGVRPPNPLTRAILWLFNF